MFTGLTGEYGGNYGPPTGFNWNFGGEGGKDDSGSDQPVEEDEELSTFNVKERVDDFVRAAMDLASHTRGSHIMFTMGSDFQYESAEEW